MGSSLHEYLNGIGKCPYRTNCAHNFSDAILQAFSRRINRLWAGIFHDHADARA